MKENVLSESWNNFENEYSKTYLHDFPKLLHAEAISHIFASAENPSIIDIGCGNCQLYKIIQSHNKEFSYTGIDWSTPLLNASNITENNFKILCADILDEKNYVGEKYDFAVISHVLEIISSPEKLLYILSKKVKYIYIIWYEYPRFEYSEFEIKNFVNNLNSDKNIYSPYLRNKYSKKYFDFLLEKNNLSNILEVQMSEKDRLTVLKTEQ